MEGFVESLKEAKNNSTKSLQQNKDEKEEDEEEKIPEGLQEEHHIPLTYAIDNITDFDEALTVINLEGEKFGVHFKRGNIHHSKQSKDIVDRSLICSFKQRNKVNKNNLKIENKTKTSLDTLPIKNSKFTDCAAKYKFVYKCGVMELNSYSEIHNHKLSLDIKVLTVPMIEDIKSFSKCDKVITIKEMLKKNTKFN